jgi:hypothetical protein
VLPASQSPHNAEAGQQLRRQTHQQASQQARQERKAEKRSRRKAERAADQAASQRLSEATVAAARQQNGVEPSWAPWFSSAEEESAAEVEDLEPTEEPADDIALTVLAEMERADKIPPDRVIPEKFRTMKWQPPWEVN